MVRVELKIRVTVIFRYQPGLISQPVAQRPQPLVAPPGVTPWDYNQPSKEAFSIFLSLSGSKSCIQIQWEISQCSILSSIRLLMEVICCSVHRSYSSVPMYMLLWKADKILCKVMIFLFR